MKMTIETLKQNNDFYRTSDLALATVISLSHPIETLDRVNPRKVFFVFKKNKDLDELLEKYWKAQLKIEPSLYFQQLKIIKTRLYSGNHNVKPESSFQK